MFFRSFSGSVGRVVIGTTIGLLCVAGTVKVAEWTPVIVETVRPLIGV